MIGRIKRWFKLRQQREILFDSALSDLYRIHYEYEANKHLEEDRLRKLQILDLERKLDTENK